MPAPTVLKTRVGIVGGGPAGLMLSHLLGRAGIDNIVVEKRDHETIRTTHRAGILEHGSVSMLVDSGVSDRVLTAGYRHEGIDLRFGGESHRIDFTDLVGEAVWLYPQNEVFVDLAAARERDGGQVHYSVSDTAVRDLTTDSPKIPSPTPRARPARSTAEILVGADGSGGICKRSIPQEHRHGQFRRVPVRLVRHSVRGAAQRRGIDLLQFRPRVRVDQPAGRQHPADVFPMPARLRTSTRGPRR